MIEQGTSTTGGAMSSPTVTISLEGSYTSPSHGLFPRVCLTPIGENLGDVNLWVSNITDAGGGTWTMIVESSVPSIDFHYRIFGYEKI